MLTPGEADEVLGLLRGMTQEGELTVLMITHKFREVMAFADDVTVLRQGRLAGSGRVAELDRDDDGGDDDRRARAAADARSRERAARPREPRAA